MDQRLQQAIASARSGKEKEAQFLLTQLLKDNPEEVHAWFLLSHLVDSEQKQLAYLKKAVAIDPNHEKAAARLSELEASLAINLHESGLSLEEEDLLPAWMKHGSEELSLEAALTDPASSEHSEAFPWLQEPSIAADMESAAAAAVEAPPSTQKTSKSAGSALEKKQAQLNRLLYLLVAATTVVTLLLLYTLFTAS